MSLSSANTTGVAAWDSSSGVRRARAMSSRAGSWTAPMTSARVKGRPGLAEGVDGPAEQGVLGGVEGSAEHGGHESGGEALAGDDVGRGRPRGGGPSG